MKDRIKLIRKSENLTQEEFGREIGATRGMVTTYEKGTVPPNATRILICNRFNINPEWLETGEGEMHKVATFTPKLTRALNKHPVLKGILEEMVSVMGDEDWDAIESIAVKVIQNKK